MDQQTVSSVMSSTLSSSSEPTTWTSGLDQETSVEFTYTSAHSLDSVPVQVYLWVTLLTVSIGIGLIVYVIAKNECFHSPHFYFMVVYMLADWLQVVGTALPSLFILATNIDLPQWYCFTVGVLPIISVIFGAHIIGVISFERYVFMCKPYIYSRHFTRRNAFLLVACIGLIDSVYVLMLEIWYPRKFYSTILLCQNTQPPFVNVLHWLYIGMPSFIVTVVATYKILVLRKCVAVAPVAIDMNAMSEPSVPVISQTFRLIVFTSGLFFIIMIPAYVGVTLVFRTGITLGDLESGANVSAARLTRCFFFFLYLVQPTLNIALHLYTHRELRTHVYRTVGAFYENLTDRLKCSTS